MSTKKVCDNCGTRSMNFSKLKWCKECGKNYCDRCGPNHSKSLGSYHNKCPHCGSEKFAFVQPIIHNKTFRTAAVAGLGYMAGKAAAKEELKRAQSQIDTGQTSVHHHLSTTDSTASASPAKRKLSRQETKQLEELRKEQYRRDLQEKAEALRADPDFQKRQRRRDQAERAIVAGGTDEASRVIDRMEAVLTQFESDIKEELSASGASPGYTRRFHKHLHKALRAQKSRIRKARSNLDKAKKYEGGGSANANSKHKLRLHYVYNVLRLMAKTFEGSINIAIIDASCRFPLPGSLKFYFREKKAFDHTKLTRTAESELNKAIPAAVLLD